MNKSVFVLITVAESILFFKIN